MLILDATTKSLEIKLAGAVAANQLPVTAHYTDITTALYMPGSSDAESNGTTAVTIVAAPGASTQRHVESISVYNADTAAVTVTIQLNNNSTLRIITKVTLQAAEQLFYEDGMGWQIIDANGAVIRGTNVSDTAYASSWDGVTTIAPSKNAVYDQMLLQMLKNGSNLAIGSDADGDMYYRASGALARLAKGTAYKHLGMNSGATAPEWQASANSVLTAAGDILYASSANTLARLAKGTANYKLFMDAAGAAPEWAGGSQLIVSTRDMTAASGNVDYTLTFAPSVLICIGASTAYMWSVGFSSGTAEYCIYSRSSDLFVPAQSILIYAYEATGKTQDAVVKTLGTTTTLTWTKTGDTAAGTFFFGLLALR